MKIGSVRSDRGKSRRREYRERTLKHREEESVWRVWRKNKEPKVPVHKYSKVK